MKYLKSYVLLIEKSKARNRPKKDNEVHHIIPKSLGGSNKKSNLVVLSKREHYIAHKLLTKIYVSGENHFKMICAMKRFHPSDESYKINSRNYEILKSKFNKLASEYMKGKNLGKKLSEDTKNKISLSQKKRYVDNPSLVKEISIRKKKEVNDRGGQKGSRNNFYGKKHTPEARAKISKAAKGIKRSKEFIEKCRSRKDSPETREKKRRAAIEQHRKRRESKNMAG